MMAGALLAYSARAVLRVQAIRSAAALGVGACIVWAVFFAAGGPIQLFDILAAKISEWMTSGLLYGGILGTIASEVLDRITRSAGREKGKRR